MSEAFRGEFSQKVDGKARVSIPAAFRRVLEAGDPAFGEGSRPRLVMVYGSADRKFVECYTITEMKKVEARIRKMPPGNRSRRYLEINLVTLSQTVEVDEDGRIVMPPKVRDKIALTAEDMKDGAEAIFAGTLDTFQIWKRDAYDAELALQADLEDDILPDGLDMLALLPHDPEE